MGGNKVKVGGAIACRRHAHHPLLKIDAATGHQAVDKEWWQREVVDAVRLISIAKVRQIFAIGNIGFGNNDGVVLSLLYQCAKQAHHLMGLLQVYTASANFFP